MSTPPTVFSLFLQNVFFFANIPLGSCVVWWVKYIQRAGAAGI